MSTAGTLEALARIVGDALSPLATRLQGDQVEATFEQLGLRLPTGALTSGALPQALEASAVACAQLPASVAVLIAADAGSDGALIAAAADLAQKIVQVGTAFGRLGTALDGVVQAAAGLTAAQKARLSAVAAELPERLFHLSLISYLADRQPSIKGGLDLVGLFDDIAVPGDPADLSQPPFHLKRVRFDRIGSLFGDPAQHLKDLYRFGRPDFDGLELFRRIKALVDRPDAQSIIITAPAQPTALEAFVFRLAVEPGAIPSLRARLRVPAEKDFTVSVPMSGPWSATVDSTARFGSSIEFLLNPQSGLHIEPPTAAASVAIAFGLKASNSDGTPMILIGQAGKSRLELVSAAARLPLLLSASTGAPSPVVKLGATLELKQGKLVIDTSDADGFIETLLGDVKVESDFDLNAVYDTDQGLRFAGSATIEIALPTHITLGPISIPTVYLIGGFKGGKVPIEFSVDMGAKLGPLAASVQRMGALATISFPKAGGNAGVAQIDVGFKSPNGVGLSVNAGIVTGGGFLNFDPDKGEYAGALQLSILDVISVSAVGLISTHMPDGSSGFSLLIIITADFGPGIQLGFGFTLLAVGGLLGLNRGVLMQPLLEGVKSNAVASVMFPRDIIANAPRIISDLKAFFPPQANTFLIGPMAKLGWGEPTLVSLSLGVIVEIPPGNVAILGILRAALPAEDAAILVLQVNFIGVFEPNKQRFYFFASLFDSHLLFITIDGQMGGLFAYGADANFVLSIGGFHPQFKPPPLPFPTPRRIQIDIINESYARIHCDGYFAVTTNTVQFGTHSSYFFGFSALSVEGHSGFDALIQFSPFHFIAEISTAFSVKVFGLGVYGIDIDLSLEGPTPWHAHGTASISFLFFSIGIGIDFTWGDNRDTSLPPVAVMPILGSELSKRSNWRALPPTQSNLLVSLRKFDTGNTADRDLVLHPVGTLQISQRAVPLDLTLDKIGSQKPSDANRFSLSAGAGPLRKTRDLQDQFAPGQFKDYSDADRLSAAAYSPSDSGIELSAPGTIYASGTAITRIVRYDVTIIDKKLLRHVWRFFLFAHSLFQHLLLGSSVARSPLSAYQKSLSRPDFGKVVFSHESFAVAFAANNQVYHAAAAHFTSVAAANDFVARTVTADPSLSGSLHVLPSFELAA